MMYTTSSSTASLSALPCVTPAFSVNTGDEIFATIEQFGRVIVSGAFSGFESVKHLINSIIAASDLNTGLITISLRNRTAGTTARRVVRLGGRPRHETPADGTQLTLAFGDAA